MGAGKSKNGGILLLRMDTADITPPRKMYNKVRPNSSCPAHNNPTATNSQIAHPVQNQEGRVYHFSDKSATAGDNLEAADAPIHTEMIYLAVS